MSGEFKKQLNIKLSPEYVMCSPDSPKAEGAQCKLVKDLSILCASAAPECKGLQVLQVKTWIAWC